jgi:hypothetical protein
MGQWRGSGVPFMISGTKCHCKNPGAFQMMSPYFMASPLGRVPLVFQVRRLAVVSALSALAACGGGGGGSDAAPQSDFEAVSQAKQLVQGIRNDARALDNIQPDVDAVTSVLRSVAVPLVGSQLASAAELLSAVDQLDLITAKPTVFTGPLPVPADFLIGEACTVYQDKDFTIEATTYESADYMVCRTTHGSAFEGARKFLTQHQVFVEPVAAAPGFARSYQVLSRIIRQEVDPSTGAWIGSEVALSAGMSELTISLSRNAKQALSQAAITGKTAGSVDSAGTLNVAQGTGLALSIKPSSVNASTHLTTVALSGQVSDLAANGSTLAAVSIKDGSQAVVPLVVDGDLNSGLKPGAFVESASLILQASSTTGTLTGTLAADTPVADKSGRKVPTALRFAGVVGNAQRTLFDGSLAVQANASAVANNLGSALDGLGLLDQASLAQATLSLKGLISLTASNNGSATLDIKLGAAPNKQVSVVGSFAHLGQTLLLSGVLDKANASSSFMQISTPEGMSVVLRNDQNTSDLTLNGEKVGVMDFDAGRITYINGDFESF